MAEGSQPGREEQAPQTAPANRRKDAVLVFGASGRLGQEVVAEVLSIHNTKLLQHFVLYRVVHHSQRHTYPPGA